MRFKCPDCSAKLDRSLEEIRCPNCGRFWRVDHGIVCFSGADYWGEIPETSLKALVDDAQKMHWRDAVAAHFGGEYYVFESIAEPNRACWKSLIPVSPHGSVLDIGSGFGAITHSLALSFDNVVSVEPILERLRFTSLRISQEGLENVDFVQSNIHNLPFFPGTFDLVVLNGILEWIGLWDESLPPRDSQREFLLKVQTFLRPGGCLVIGIENRLGFQYFLGSLDHPGSRFTTLLPRKLATWYIRLLRPGFYRANPSERGEYRTFTYTEAGYRKLLSQAGFYDIEAYYPFPDYNKPSAVIPMQDRKGIAQHLYQDILLCNRRYGTTLLRRVKRFVIRSGIYHHFVPAFLLFAQKPSSEKCGSFRGTDNRERTSKSDSVIGAIDRIVRSKIDGEVQGKFSFFLRAQPFKEKQIILVRQSGGEGVAVAKLFNKREEGQSSCRKGYENLERIYRTWGDTTLVQESVPRPMAFLDVGRTSLTIEAHLKGVPFSSIVWEEDYFSDRALVEKHLKTVAEWIIALFETTNRGRVRENPSSYYQHGDFFVDNILLDIDRNRIGVVDWDGFGDTYPPLFDFFCLLSEMFFLVSAPRRMSKWQTEMLSFNDTFFGKNWFSSLVRDICRHLCLTFDLQPSSAAHWFSQYLSTRQALYTGGSETPANREYCELYGEYIRFWQTNRFRFTLNDL